MVPRKATIEYWKATALQIENFINQTCLVPVVVLDTVNDEIYASIQDTQVYEYLRSAPVVTYIESRSALCFEHHKHFHSKMLRTDPRPLYHAFVRHWVTGLVKEHFGHLRYERLFRGY